MIQSKNSCCKFKDYFFLKSNCHKKNFPTSQSSWENQRNDYNCNPSYRFLETSMPFQTLRAFLWLRRFRLHRRNLRRTALVGGIMPTDDLRHHGVIIAVGVDVLGRHGLQVIHQHFEFTCCLALQIDERHGLHQPAVGLVHLELLGCQDFQSFSDALDAFWKLGEFVHMGLHLRLGQLTKQNGHSTQQGVDTHARERLAKRPEQSLKHLSASLQFGIRRTTVRFDATDSRHDTLFEQLCLLLHMVLHRSDMHRFEKHLVGVFHSLKKHVQIFVRTLAFEVAADLTESRVELIRVQYHKQM